MAAAMVVTAAPVSADAKAKKPKLSKTKVTVKKGKKVTIKVKGKKVKKTTWSVNKKGKKVVSLSKKKKKSVVIKGKKKGKATVTAKIKVGKKTYKKTVKVTVKAGGSSDSTKAPAATTAAVASKAPGSSNAPGSSKAPGSSSAPGSSKAPGSSSAPGSSKAPGSSDAPVMTPPVQPDKPSTPAKELPELNLREEMATEWTTGGSYGTAVFNTDDSVDFNSQPWAEGATGSCYNNGLAWYVSKDKTAVDLSAYTGLELTIKTDAEIKMMSWGGSADAASFWDKTDLWGGSTNTVENDDGSKTITYPLKDLFGNDKKVQKAIAIGLTLKSDLDGDDQQFKAREATIYGMKLVGGGASQPTEPVTSSAPTEPVSSTAPTTGSAASAAPSTGSAASAAPSTGSAASAAPSTGSAASAAPSQAPVASIAPSQAPVAEPILTLDTTGFYPFADMEGVTFDTTKTYSNVKVKIKAYNASGDVITEEDENYKAFQGYSKVSAANADNCKISFDSGNDVGAGNGDGIAWHNSGYSVSAGQYMLNNLGKYGVTVDKDGYFTITIDLRKPDDADNPTAYHATDCFAPGTDYTGFGFQTTSDTAGVPKIEIYEITFTEKK